MHEEKKEPSANSDWKVESLKVLKSKPAVITISVALGLVFLRLGVNYFMEKENVKVQNLIAVVHPSIKKMDKTLTLPGNVEAIQQANIFSHVSGYLKKILVDEGDKVKENQLLAEIDAPDVVQEFNKVSAENDLKQKIRTRYKDLVADRVISQQEYDVVDADANESAARLSNARANVEYTRIRAPFAGSIARRFKYPGDLISVGAQSRGNESAIFVLVNEKLLRVAINVPQSDIGDLQIGNLVDISFSSTEVRVVQGKISRIDSLLDESTKTQRVLIDLDNKDGLLHAGMFATVTLHFRTNEHALVVPKESVFEMSGKEAFAWKVVDGKLQKTHIRMGIQANDLVEIAEGLTETDVVVAKASPLFTEGSAVVPKE